MAPKTWFPEVLRGSLVTLRRHVPENLAAFHRWYADPEIARLARYQEAPMRADEIERFFAARVVGTGALAMAIHEAATDRLIGTCAFSQLDADNGSALYHITIGEQDAWGRGFGTEATQLMLDHAFGTLGLHRIALYVFEFNERAIRAYRRCGFVIEGRSRESIWRDGRWWDELAMSVLEADWRERRAAAGTDDERRQRTSMRAHRMSKRGGRTPTTARPRCAVPAPPGCSPRRCGGSDELDRRGRRCGQGRRPRADRGQGSLGRQRACGRRAARGRRSRTARCVRTPSMDQYLMDLMQALEQDEGEKLGGKSAEAARFILRAVDRELDQA